MKDKLSTKKQLRNAQKAFTDFGTKYLLDWTQKELKKFYNEPVLIPQGKYGFFVGKFEIKGIEKNCWQVKHFDGNEIHSFISKKNSILYCLYEVTQRYNAAQEILEIDRILGNLENNIANYQHTIKNNKDKNKKDIALNRYIEAKFKHVEYSKILKKTLNSAKYINFGN